MRPRIALPSDRSAHSNKDFENSRAYTDFLTLPEAVAHYALGNMNNRVLAREYKLNLPDESLLINEIAKTRSALQLRASIQRGSTITDREPT